MPQLTANIPPPVFPPNRMMRLNVLLILLLMSMTVLAEEKKRPSWSQGLPEKSEAPAVNRPQLDAPSLRPDAPQIEIDIPRQDIAPMPATRDSFELDIEPVGNQSAASEKPAVESNQPAVTTVVDEPVNALPDPLPESPATQKVVEPPVAQAEQAAMVIRSKPDMPALPASYSWSLERQYPVRVSANVLKQYNSVLLKIMINRSGEVVGVEKVIADTPDLVVKQAEQSINRWRFTAPADEGIEDQLLSRVIKVQLTAR